MYPDEKFKVQGNDTEGWLYSLGETENFRGGVDVSDYLSKPLFFLNSDRYWLGSPVAGDIRNVSLVREQITHGHYYGSDNPQIGARPIVSIPKTAFDQLVK